MLEESGLVSHAASVLALRAALGSGCITSSGVDSRAAPGPQGVDGKAITTATNAVVAQEKQVRQLECWWRA